MSYTVVNDLDDFGREPRTFCNLGRNIHSKTDSASLTSERIFGQAMVRPWGYSDASNFGGAPPYFLGAVDGVVGVNESKSC